MAVGDIFRIALVGGLNSQEVVNVFHYRQTTANSSVNSDVKSAALAFRDVMLPLVADAMSRDVQYGVIESRSFIPPGGPMVGWDEAVSEPGHVDEDAAPPTVAVVIRKKTAFLGRKYRGRNYFAGVPVVDIVSGKIGVGHESLWQNLRDGMAGTIAASGVAGTPTFAPVIAALDSSVIVTPVGVRWQAITQCVLDLVLRSQRRREIGVGS